MAIPLIPFVAGAVIGGLSAYFYRDERLRKEVRRTAGDLSGKVKETADNVSHRVAEGWSGMRDKVTGRSNESAAAPTRKAATRKTGKKKAAAKKKVAKKKAAAKKKAPAAAKTPDDE